MQLLCLKNLKNVTHSGKRYHSAQKFEIALVGPRERAKRKEYDGANPAFVVHSCDASCPSRYRIVTMKKCVLKLRLDCTRPPRSMAGLRTPKPVFAASFKLLGVADKLCSNTERELKGHTFILHQKAQNGTSSQSGSQILQKVRLEPGHGLQHKFSLMMAALYLDGISTKCYICVQNLYMHKMWKLRPQLVFKQNIMSYLCHCIIQVHHIKTRIVSLVCCKFHCWSCDLSPIISCNQF